MPGKHNAGGCKCCGPACQSAWNDLIARFTNYEITGTTLTTKSGTLKTGGFTEAGGCGDSQTAYECDADGIVMIDTGSTCYGSFYEGRWRYTMGTCPGTSNKYVCYATFTLAAEIVSGTPRWKAEYVVVCRVQASGAKVCKCDVSDYYLSDPYAGGLVYQNGSSIALYSGTDITLNLGDDITYSYAQQMYADLHPTSVFDCTTPYSLAADDTPATGYYDYVTEYRYGKYRGVYSTNVNDIPTSVSLTPLVNPGGVDATFTFT